MTTIASRFRTPEGATRFLAAYEATLALWPVAHRATEITTTFGTTHVNISGAPDLPPLLLIHGAQISSPVWYANIEALSRHFCVYAPDVVDQIGLGVPTRKLKTAQDCLTWIVELLDGLGLNSVTVIGHSQGGYQALNLAINAPQRVKKLVLLSPSGSLGRVRMQLLLHMLPVFVRPTRKTFYGSFQWMTTMPLGTAHPLVEQFMTGALTFKPQELGLGAVSVFKDEALQSIKMPTLLLIGAKDGTCRPRVELERAQRLIPHIETELIAGGGHLFPVDQAEVTNARILKFLQVN